jgi:hypothetical protein
MLRILRYKKGSARAMIERCQEGGNAVKNVKKGKYEDDGRVEPWL